jgi:diguanylate cyclase (GGDEF)-like protein/PAS domain S-box-containing protein
MLVQKRLRILATVTVIALIVAVVSLLVSFHFIYAAEQATQRDEELSRIFIEIKAEAISTIMLDPSKLETRKVFSSAERKIRQHITQIEHIRTRIETKRELDSLMLLWDQYDQASQALIKQVEIAPDIAKDKVIPLYTNKFIPVQDALEPIIFRHIKLSDKSRKNVIDLVDTISWVVPLLIGAIVFGIFIFIRIISRYILQEESAFNSTKAALQLAAMVYENSSEAILVSDAENRIIDVNPAFEQITGYTAEEVQGRNPSMFQSGRQDKEFYQKLWHALKTDGYWHGELWDKRKDGEIHAKLLTINTIKDSMGKVFRYVAIFTDITEQKNTEALIWSQANFDSLTKLPNRHMFHDRLEQQAKQSNRTGRPMALMLIDLDLFKEVNDTHGHDKGDLLLIDAAKRISACVRESDTVSRLGGDEFTVLLTELDDTHTVERIVQDINTKLTEPFKLGEYQAFISASIGISLYPNDTEDLDSLLKNADQAMYVAKNAGRNRSSYFTPDLQYLAQKRLHLINDLRIALVSNQFRVYYQPIVELATGQIHKAEALIRWQHPVHGMVSPIDFIPLAEDTRLIIPIGDWVFREAVNQVKQWRSKYHESFQISVNKSPVQIHKKEGMTWPDYLKQQGMSGQSISVEITEGILMNEDASVKESLLRFRDAGIQIAIDDFGTGYSSLAYLNKFDIDYLKIDQSFVRNIGPTSSDQALCEAIIVMAHKLGLKVIAEGLETAAQHDMLFAAGCDFAQGYLYSKPLPPEEFEKFMQARYGQMVMQ